MKNEQLSEKLTHAATEVTVGGRYMHYKQRSYKVLAVALREDDCTPCVVYQAEYGDKLTWVRPLASWLETVQVDGQPVARFAKIDE